MILVDNQVYDISLV